jgi:Fis family transcriptional regulator
LDAADLLATAFSGARSPLAEKSREHPMTRSIKGFFSPAATGDVMFEAVRLMHSSGLLLPEAARAFKKCWIERVLEECRGNQKRAAIELGMHRNTLSRTIHELKIQAWAFKPKGSRPPDSPAVRLVKSEAGRRAHARVAQPPSAVSSSSSSGGPPPVFGEGGGRGRIARAAAGRSHSPRGEKLPGLDLDCGRLTS